MSDEDNAMCYVGKKSCGCTIGVAVDEPEHKTTTAKWVARWIKAGATIHRMTVKEFRVDPSSFGCDCEKTGQQLSLLATGGPR